MKQENLPFKSKQTYEELFLSWAYHSPVIFSPFQIPHQKNFRLWETDIDADIDIEIDMNID